jgi:hypothetical protein
LPAWVATAGICLTAIPLAQAQPVTEGQTPLPVGTAPQAQHGKSADDWRFGATFYGWATNLSGSATARGNTVGFNASIIDIFQKSDSVLAWDSYFEAAKGRFGAYLDVVWSRVRIPKSAASYANPIGGLALSAQGSGSVTSTLTIIEGGAFYEIARWPGGDGTSTTLDGFAGLRYWNSSAQVSLDVTGNLDFSDPRLGRLDRSRSIAIADSGSLQWVDPLIGLRARHWLTPSQEIMVRGDIGGFGIPGGSWFSWQLVGVYSYTWQFDGYAIAALAGYRALSTNVGFNSGSVDASGLNLLVHGPLLGVTVKF